MLEVAFTHQPIVIPPPAYPSREIGACVEFLGIVREMEAGTALAGLYYEAYEPMARTAFARIAQELQAHHPVAGALLIHRLGWVPVGEPSLFVRVISRNRGPALHFCEALIDRMKQDVPIWKADPPPEFARP
jgi:molybdopterin synthase catalytic subunit